MQSILTLSTIAKIPFFLSEVEAEDYTQRLDGVSNEERDPTVSDVPCRYPGPGCLQWRDQLEERKGNRTVTVFEIY